MSSDSSRNERFLSRWSRLKHEQAGPAEAKSEVTGLPEGVTIQRVAGESAATPAGSHVGAAPDGVRTRPTADSVAPRANADAVSLPPIDTLTIDSDYAPFFQPHVPENLRNAAVKKLFADPHFNIMDGLDTYIDDYTKADPLPEGWLEKMTHARDLLDHPSNRQPVVDAAPASGVEPAAVKSPDDVKRRTSDDVDQESASDDVEENASDDVEEKISDDVEDNTSDDVEDNTSDDVEETSITSDNIKERSSDNIKERSSDNVKERTPTTTNRPAIAATDLGPIALPNPIPDGQVTTHRNTIP